MSVFEKFKKKTVEDVVTTARKEVDKCIDDYAPVIFAAIGVLFFIACVGRPHHPVASTITINNYYFGR